VTALVAKSLPFAVGALLGTVDARTGKDIDHMVGITYILTAQDPVRARAFYQDAFGARTNWAAPDGTWSVMELGRREFCIEGNGSGELLNSGLSIEVADLEQACTAVERAGGRIYRPNDRIVIVTDTEGNRFSVIGPGGCNMHAAKFPEPAATATATA
jgi:predicted enzyme related to lactoylglutathione lyase